MPKPFRLQTLLEHKARLEERQMLVLAARDAERRRAGDVLQVLHEAAVEQLRHMETLARDARIDAQQHRDAVAYLSRLEASIVLQRDVIAEAESRVQEGRDALVAILKEKRALERLREQHESEVALEDGRRESRMVDEITSARYVRRLQGRA
ncbi:MAG: flagellar export protein FliJ [Dehalococcoidia bacterium]